MCLSTLTAGPDETASGRGWKVFRTSLDGGLSGMYHGDMDIYFPGDCYFARVTKHDYPAYSTGFHIFTNPEDAEAYMCHRDPGGYLGLVVRQVEWSDRLA